jgi:PAS domain S-box-containing protein
MMRSGMNSAGTRESCPAQGQGASADLMSADVSGILDMIDVPIIVVGRDCTVARFNHAATEVLGLTLSDIGRLVGDMSALAEVNGCEKWCAQVITDGTPCRREIRNGDRWFLLRIAPYITSDRQTVGAVLSFTNVTAFRESIAQALYDREYTKAILNTGVDPLVVLDAELRVQTANRAFFTMFGVSREVSENVPLCDLGHEDWKTPALWPLLRASLSDKVEFQTLEVERHFPSIGRRTLLVDARPLSRAGDALILLVLRDITERKQAEEKVRGAEQELRDFIENATVGMHWVGPDGIILWANRTELEMLGFAPEEYLGHHISEFHADAAAIEDILQRLGDHETILEYPARLCCKDGSIRDVIINSNVLWDRDQFIHTRCFTRDVTERRQAEAALRESESRFRKMIDALPVAIYTTDAQGRLTHFNRAAVELSGRQLELGADYSWVTSKVCRPDGTPLPHDENPMAIALKEGRPISGVQAVAERPDGTRFWFEPYPTPLFDAEGMLTGGINMLLDITDRKAAEAALRQSEQEARQARDEAERASQAKDSFLATLSHELRTPLSPVLMTAAALETDATLPPEMRDQITMIRRNVELEARLIDDLLDVTRISRGKLQMAPEIADIHRLLEYTAEIVRSDELDRQVRVEFKLEAQCHHTLGDPARLQQVFWNLIKNAIKFTPAGGSVTLITSNDDSGMIVVRVVDTGIGIGAELLPRIFAAFEQGEAAHNPRFGGLGLGLAISKAIVEMHQGVIHAESPGHGLGATFTVVLTAAEAQETPSRSRSAPTGEQRPLRLLLVEDHEATLTVLTRLLRRSGHAVIPTRSVSEALAAASAGRFDAVISDLGLPDGSGIDLMREIQRDPMNAYPGIALSGYGADEDVRKSKDAGFFAHLVKPVNIHRLRELLSQIPDEGQASAPSVLSNKI